MALRLGLWSLLAITRTLAATTTISDTTATGSTVSTTEEASPTGSYLSYTSQSSQDTTGLGSLQDGATSMATDNATETDTQSQVKQTSSKNTVTYLTGSAATTTASTATSGAGSNGTATRTTSSSSASSASVTNTQPCNNYAEFCSRKYGNITEISCHNSPFVVSNNLAANQEYGVTQQLDDGVRFLQAQMQWPTNGSEPHFCHTSCDILDAGPITDWLGQVKDWVAAHPYDVVTILLENGNYSNPSLYVPYIQQTGILRYIYTPPLVPMELDDWPTLSEMILSGTRVVMFLDYQANQTAYPWLLDEFSQMWETEFDPTDQAFPCDVSRPPNLAAADARKRLSLINHNLNIELDLLGSDVLVPARTELNVTNAAGDAFGSLGRAAANCTAAHGGVRPKFLNVDYYNYGDQAGSVFQVAATMNNVTYSRQCCGVSTSAAAAGPLHRFGLGLAHSLVVMLLLWRVL